MRTHKKKGAASFEAAPSLFALSDTQRFSECLTHGVALELQSAGELNHPRRRACRGSSQQPAERGGVNVGLGKLRVRRGESKVGPVEHVEKLCPHLKTHFLSESNVLDDRSVPIESPWQVQEVGLHVSSLARCHVKEHLAGECRLIESQSGDACRRARQTRSGQSQLALRHIQIDDRRVNKEHPTRSAEGAD